MQLAGPLRMSFRIWTGSKWRTVSKAEAQLRRARGQKVVESEAGHDLKPPAPVETPAAVLATFIAAPATPAFDLTDDELEKLTAPGGEG